MANIKEVITKKSKAIVIGGIAGAVVFLIVKWMPLMYVSFATALVGLVFYVKDKKRTTQKDKK